MVTIALMIVIALIMAGGGTALSYRAIKHGLRCKDPEGVFCGALIGASSLMPLAIVWDLLCVS